MHFTLFKMNASFRLNISKIISFLSLNESFIAKCIINDISVKLDPKQYGNIKGSSTSHYLVDILNSVHEGLDKPNHYAYLAAIDFTKAFDLVNHNHQTNQPWG